jgi:GTP 3',8-cyclase
MLRDGKLRTIGYLRLSLTPACHMRCVYCRPGFHRNEPRDLLQAGEIEPMVRHLVTTHGVRKVRLTGGDPTARSGLTEIIRAVAGVEGVKEVAMTTNGLLLGTRAREYREAGLRRVNISLDSLDPERFHRMTGLDQLDRVLEGIDAALDAGLEPVRINTVVLKGENEDELPDLVSFALDRGLEIRFIELMPMGPLAPKWKERYVPAPRMQEVLSPRVREWVRLPQGSESATRFRITLDDGREGTVGFITPMSCNFCAACDRIRITADGTFYPCLMDRPGGSLMPALRPTFDPELFDRLLVRGLQGKAAEHPAEGFAIMTNIGG